MYPLNTKGEAFKGEEGSCTGKGAVLGTTKKTTGCEIKGTQTFRQAHGKKNGCVKTELKKKNSLVSSPRCETKKTKKGRGEHKDP